MITFLITTTTIRVVFIIMMKKRFLPQSREFGYLGTSLSGAN